MLEFWEAERVFERIIEQGSDRELFVFYEGPPTANGRPGIHHVLARTFKDLYPRYKTMRGFHCPRKAGWDTHGLPVEHEVEKALGIFDKKRIEREVGIASFVEQCRSSVMRYVADWERMTRRMAFWVDFDDAYFTLHNSYIESVWQLLKRIFDRGLMYQGYKVVPYDPRIGATLSANEVSLGYREVDDPSVFVRFRLADDESVAFLVWTTTPWTLPSNLLLAVHPEVEYLRVEHEGETLILARELADRVLGEGTYRILSSCRGAELDGLRYRRLFDYLPVEGDICRVRTADFVTTEDGTGIVHIAPAYGEDDLKLGLANGVSVVHGVGEDGCFVDAVTPVAGKFFKDADPILIALLQERGDLFRAGTYTHNYPFGWRTGDPLINYAKHAWYIRTTAFQDRLVELNETINWVPAHIKHGRFGNWLANNIDWALSRERFWGTPLPLWTDGDGDYVCVGSVAELEQLSGLKLDALDLHRPAVDEVTFIRDGREYRRVPEVIDCWFDSGAMPFAQWHYPFENAETFRHHYPADFICEAIDQTRGWFYTLHAISTIVEDSVAYRNVVCLSHIVDADGKKMSKSLGNILDPYAVFDSVGADALRWHFTARVAPDLQKRLSVEIVQEVASSFINTLWNTYAFFVMYANLDAVDLERAIPVAARPEVDRWVLALLDETIRTATEALDAYDAQRAGLAIEAFVDQLSNWYVRLNRRRFWKAASGDDKQAAYLTLYECLDAVHRLMAPFVPFLSEEIFQNLVRSVDASAPLSVHMGGWPESLAERRNTSLIAETEVVQRVVGLGRSARNASKLKVRQPLSRLLVRVPDEFAAQAVRRHEGLIRDELNVKAIELIARDASLVSYRIKPNLPVVGKRYGKQIPAIREFLKSADGGRIAAAVASGETQEFPIGGELLRFEPGDLLVETESAEGFACAEEGGYLAGLDTSLTEDLIREGIARELIRIVQDTRKQAGLEVSDRIELIIEGDAAVADAIARHRDTIMSETLATSWGSPSTHSGLRVEGHFGSDAWMVHLARTDAAP